MLSASGESAATGDFKTLDRRPGKTGKSGLCDRSAAMWRGTNQNQVSVKHNLALHTGKCVGATNIRSCTPYILIKIYE